MTVEPFPLDLASAVVDGLNPASPTYVRRRQGVVAGASSGPPVTVNVTIGGITIPGVRVLSGYTPVVGDSIMVDFNGPDPMVIGSAGGASTVPVGAVTAFYGTSAPAGWLVCDGSSFSGTTYPVLAALLGGTTLPNLKGKVVVGYNPAETEFDSLGETGGVKTVALAVTEMPGHGHGMELHNHGITVDTNSFNTGGTTVNHSHAQYGGYTNNSTHTHANAGPGAAENPNPVAGVAGNMGNTAGQSADHGHYAGHSHTGSSGDPGGYHGGQPQTGSNQAHQNLQPYIALAYIIRAG